MEGITFSRTKKDRTPWGLVQTVLVYRNGEEIGSLYKESPEMPEFYADATLESYYGEEFCHGNLRECKKAVVEAHKANPKAEESIPNHDYDDEPDKPEPEPSVQVEPEAQPVQAEATGQEAEATPWPDKQAARLARLLAHLADEANQAQLAALYEPSSWAADRYETLVRDLWRQADNARQEGPGEGPKPKPEPVKTDPPVCGGVFIPPHLL